ncbi:MAG: hypothetical protein M1837_003901 [Sclerophora amabilis]|nr:MAG: hypothetical protein M1837_003901 [Sclerophora amabilis]
MLFKSILVGVSALASLTFAQRLAFTSGPEGTVEAGTTSEIAWSGGDGNPITLRLKNGDSDNLNTVSTIASGLTTNNYDWDIPTTITDGEYSIEIAQGSDFNYYGPFEITGGKGAGASSSNASASSSAAISSAVDSIIASVTANLNSTIIRPTGTAPLTTGGRDASASGTGTAIYRNTTLSSATLSAPTATDTEVTGADATATEADRTGGASEASGTAAPNDNGAAAFSSPLALVLSALVAMIFLN